MEIREIQKQLIDYKGFFLKLYSCKHSFPLRKLIQLFLSHLGEANLNWASPAGLCHNTPLAPDQASILKATPVQSASLPVEPQVQTIEQEGSVHIFSHSKDICGCTGPELGNECRSGNIHTIRHILFPQLKHHQRKSSVAKGLQPDLNNRRPTASASGLLPNSSCSIIFRKSLAQLGSSSTLGVYINTLYFFTPLWKAKSMAQFNSSDNILLA